MLKKQLRLSHATLRNELSPDSRENFSLNIANHCLQLPVWNLQIFHIFLSIPQRNEVDTSFLLTVLQGKDKDIAVPKVSGKGELVHYLLTDATVFRNSRWGIPEPVSGIQVIPRQIDVVFLPLLAFDLEGYRVGYGGGFYDRFLANCREDVVKVGLSFFEPVAEISDRHPMDIPMDYCVTPEKIYSF
ncbi:MAG: 5-formyltetrahydrofolate cyclo-ligase [Robiginitalea sp.]|jgi:5-formyltetrahydrofolate cyclo-ligase